MAGNKIAPIRLDVRHMFAASLGRGLGLSAGHLERIKPLAATVHDDLVRQRRRGELLIHRLPQQQDTGPVKRVARRLRRTVQDLVVLGIGGSALGAVALQTALCPPFYNLLPDAKRKGPRLFVMDNVDPDTFAALLDLLRGREVAVNVISKSGGTAETMAQFMVVYHRLKRQLGPDKLRERLILTTDPSSGNLRRIAQEEGLTALDVPPAVGGRYSVLTPVGLLPAATVGIDIDALLSGAGAMARRCSKADPVANPAYALGAALHLADAALGRRVHVLMPYADGLRQFAAWYAQLWAESLGKRYDRSGREVNVGPTPVAALGATDQHSQLQLYMEGPLDKVVMFMFVESFRRKVAIPKVFRAIDGLSYLGGHDLGRLLQAEGFATRAALTQAGRMNLTITLPAVDAPSVGQALMLFEAATVFAGGLYAVNPLDQPGVELSKKLTYGLLGRPGFEDYAARVPTDMRFKN